MLARNCVNCVEIRLELRERERERERGREREGERTLVCIAKFNSKIITYSESVLENRF
jgi:hypothetical protein